MIVAAVSLGGASVSALVPWPGGEALAATASSVVCSSSSHPALAAKLARDIQTARRVRVSTVAVRVDDPAAGLSCSLNAAMHFDSASVVKATILGALLRKAMEQHRFLTRAEADLARSMITISDNGAASALWNDVGRGWLQHFLNLAGMRQTFLGPGGYWGLTQITASDETLLLRLLRDSNPVLNSASRSYALGLMASVVPSQRWGVAAGAPTSLTAHIKNGWLPRSTHEWRIHSIGVFTGRGTGYSIVVLTEDDPTMPYGIATIEAIARVIHRDLNPGTASVIPQSTAAPSWSTPDEDIPALPSVP
ncbi:MAG: serine hydrolase [Streptosporangiaceae bacterium]|nr:serine hydrolase [Streptosporangiaceae bacterium]